jgi:hypothetical protein
MNRVVTNSRKYVRIELDLTAEDAWDLAQFLKRVGFREFRINAANDDEAYRMRDAANLVRKALAQSGFAPR